MGHGLRLGQLDWRHIEICWACENIWVLENWFKRVCFLRVFYRRDENFYCFYYFIIQQRSRIFLYIRPGDLTLQCSPGRHICELDLFQEMQVHSEVRALRNSWLEMVSTLFSSPWRIFYNQLRCCFHQASVTCKSLVNEALKHRKAFWFLILKQRPSFSR